MNRHRCTALLALASLACVSSNPSRKPAAPVPAATPVSESAPGVATGSQAAETAPDAPPERDPHADAPRAPAQPIEDAAADALLERARALLEEARVARKEQDPALARAKSAEAIEALLSASDDTDGGKRADLLSALGQFAYAAGELDLARRAHERVLGFCERTLPADHLAIQLEREHLANTLYKLGDVAGARALVEKVIEVRLRTLPEESEDLLRAQTNLAAMLYTSRDFTGAQALLEKVLEIRLRTRPGDDFKIESTRILLATAIKELGDLERARELEEKVLEVFSRTLPDDDPSFQVVRGNYALTLDALGDLQGARVLEEKVLGVRSRTLPDDHPDVQLARNNLAMTIRELGDLQGARAIEEKVLDVDSRTLTEDHPLLQLARLNLAITIKQLGDYAGARALEERVLEVRSRNLPDDHPDVQWARGNLAGTLAELGDLAGAQELFEKVVEIRSRTLPPDHPDLQIARLNLAETRRHLGDLSGARALVEKVLEVYSRTLADDHPDLQKTRRELAVTILCEEARDPARESGAARDRCIQLVLSSCRAQTHAVRSVPLSSPSREAEERCSRLAEELDVTLSFARGYGVMEPLHELDQASFALSETARGAAIVSAGLARKASAAPGYPELRASLVKASDELAALAQGGATSGALDAARNKRESAERKLLELAHEVAGGELAGIDLAVSSLSSRLGEHAASVSFRRFKDSRIEIPRDPGASGQAALREVTVDHLCAFVVRGDAVDAATSASGNPSERLTFVDLGPMEPIDAAIRAWRDAIGVGLDRGIGRPISGPDRVRSTSRALRGFVFDPLLPAIGDASRLVVILDDVLNLVPLEALLLEDSDDLVGDRWTIETRATLTELFADVPATNGEALLALGGPSFNSEPAGLSQVEADAVEADQPTRTAALLRGGAWEPGFPPLPETGEEARGIGALYEEAFADRRPVLVLEKRKASREALFELAPKARFLHVATHGWFAPESIRSSRDSTPLDAKSGLGVRMTGEERVRGMSPMLLCGLALAGANLPENAAGRAPGLVTADEVSALDLSSCELAVLSACDTSVGERRAGQGVASLQRALQMAGARTVITSLWKVPDEATKELMLDFYRRIWFETKPKSQALWEAKKRLRDARDERGLPKYSTRDWAAWVLTGEPN